MKQEMKVKRKEDEREQKGALDALDNSLEICK